MFLKSLRHAINITKSSLSAARCYRTECPKVESAFSALSFNSFQHQEKSPDDAVELKFTPRSLLYNANNTIISPVKPNILDFPIIKIPNLIPNNKKNIIINDIFPIINDLECPTSTDKTIEKKAERDIIQRRRKMKKHQLKKWRRKYKFFLKKRNQRKALRKEKVFHAKLLNQIKLAETFDPEQFVVEKLKKAADVPVYIPFQRPGITGNIMHHPGLPEEAEVKQKK